MLLVAGRLGWSEIGIDETSGRKIAAKGRFGIRCGPRDQVLSRIYKSLMLTRIGRHWALPFLTALVVSARYRRKGRRHKTVTDSQQMLVCLRRWLPDRDLVVVARYAKREFLRHPEYVKGLTAQGRVPVPARATAAARPPGGRSAIAQSHGGAGRSRIHNGFPTDRLMQAPTPRRAFPYAGSSLHRSSAAVAGEALGMETQNAALCAIAATLAARPFADQTTEIAVRPRSPRTTG